jgi:hypothetical protein
MPVGTFHAYKDRPTIPPVGPTSLGWSEVQHRFFRRIGSRRPGLRWLTSLIQKIWDIALDIWDHRKLVLHDMEHSLARGLPIHQITVEFLMGTAGLPADVKVHFGRGLDSNNNQCIKLPD